MNQIQGAIFENSARSQNTIWKNRKQRDVRDNNEVQRKMKREMQRGVSMMGRQHPINIYPSN
jgi:hypothetical protein